MNDNSPNLNEKPIHKAKSFDIQKPPRVYVREIVSVPRQYPQKNRSLRWILGLLAGIIIVLGVFVVARAANLSNKIFVGQKTSFYQKVKDFIRGSAGHVRLQGEDLNQVNVLLLGIGGEGHDGPYLTDTIILAQIRPDLQAITLISIPRDFLINTPALGDRKINAAFAEGYGRTKDWDVAGLWARQAVEKVSGLTIPYFGVVDFAGFEQAIDMIGGVDVKIDRTFTDFSFPNDTNHGYLAPITFTAGNEHMNGKRALIFARSRHAGGPEGSDFARSARQQKIIEEVKTKVVSLNLISDASKLNNLVSIFADHVHTNINPGEMFRLYTLVKDYGSDNTTSLSLDPSTHLVCNGTVEETGAFVIRPCEGVNASDIHDFFKNSFTSGKLVSEKPIIWLADTAKDPVRKNLVQKSLEKLGLSVYLVNYNSPALDHTVVFQVNPKPRTTEYIKQNFSAMESKLPPPNFKIDPGKVDLILILGEK